MSRRLRRVEERSAPVQQEFVDLLDAALDARFAWSSLGATAFFAAVAFGFPWLVTTSSTGELTRWLFGE